MKMRERIQERSSKESQNQSEISVILCGKQKQHLQVRQEEERSRSYEKDKLKEGKRGGAISTQSREKKGRAGKDAFAIE